MPNRQQTLGRHGLSRMLAPHAVDAFFAETFERELLHVERNDPDYFADVYGVADVEDALVVGARQPENFSLFKAGSADLPAREYTYARPGVRWRFTGNVPSICIDARKVITYWERGYTLTIKDAGNFSARLQRFSNAIARDCRSYAQVNVYFTPPAAKAFDVHHDTHDTLIAQIEGEKTWRIYEPLVALPLETQQFHSGQRVEGLKLMREVVLRPGDTLYLPRGYPHDADTAAHASLHCTFALIPVRVADVMGHLVNAAGDRDVRYRRGLSRAPNEEQDALVAELVTLGENLPGTTPERVAFALEAALSDQYRLMRANTDGSFDQALRLAGLRDADVLRIDDGVPYLFRERATGIDLLIAGKSIEFPKPCATAFRRLETGPIVVGDLDPALSPAERTLLIRLLVLEGLVRIEDR